MHIKSGKIVNQKFINLSNLSSGYYLLKIFSKNTVITKKIMLK
ncbi:hypothetical protein IMCC3317_01360 [Kordia antarctica]|uniref:Secretion system C-terminal sorting domain-containing protein n=2 Tax=Kordia antarctica TaxID=1218801 RepID=A0A7L4ZD52_9FLAO|nr:hypothetical protein IMCC3317_01360 [Kordia antarctica]